VELEIVKGDKNLTLLSWVPDAAPDIAKDPDPPIPPKDIANPAVGKTPGNADW
jgi:hypothetical protein